MYVQICGIIMCDPMLASYSSTIDPAATSGSGNRTIALMIIDKRRQTTTAPDDGDTSNGGGLRCPICALRCACQSKLNTHLRRHADHRPYACDRCAAAFCTRSSLRRHERTHSDYCQFQCQVEVCLYDHYFVYLNLFQNCSKLFKFRADLLRHERNMHAQYRVQFRCELCAKCYRTLAACNEHMRSHFAGESDGLCSSWK